MSLQNISPDNSPNWTRRLAKRRKNDAPPFGGSLRQQIINPNFIELGKRKLMQPEPPQTPENECVEFRNDTVYQDLERDPAYAAYCEGYEAAKSESRYEVEGLRAQLHVQLQAREKDKGEIQAWKGLQARLFKALEEQHKQRQQQIEAQKVQIRSQQEQIQAQQLQLQALELQQNSFDVLNILE